MTDINTYIIEKMEKYMGIKLYKNDKIDFIKKFDELNENDFVSFFMKNPISVISSTNRNKITTEKLGKKEIKDLHNLIKQCINSQVEKENEVENKNSLFTDSDESNRKNVIISFFIFFFIVLIKHLIVNSITN